MTKFPGAEALETPPRGGWRVSSNSKTTHPMRLPNAKLAFLDDAKLSEYCLNPHHPRGKHKARRFAAAGITEASLPLLRAALLDAAHSSEATLGEADAHGRRFALEFDLHGSHGVVRVRSAWIIRSGEDFPRLVSCYIV